MTAPKLSDVFLAALETRTSADRTALLADVCAEQPDVRRRVERMLEAHSRLGDFLQSPALGGSFEDSVSDLGFLAPSEQPGSLGRIGHYEVQEIIGRGGFGLVLKAFDEKLHRTVAIKTLAQPLSASAVARQRFVREARAAAAVNHENVVRIFEVEEASPTPYLVMEYVAGQSLQDRLAAGPLPLDEVLRIGSQITAGLAAAHSQGLVHRDVKPANVLLEEATLRVRLTDFGLARAVDDVSLTHEGTLAGTPEYMSPEQARGQPVDHRSDLFSLGSVLYAMCVGRPAFEALGGALPTLRQICEQEPLPISACNRTIPQWLGKLIQRLHAKNPAERFQRAAEVVAVLQQGATVDTKQQPSPNRWWAALLALTAAVPISVGIGWQIIVRVKSPDGVEATIRLPANASVELERNGQHIASVSGDAAGPTHRTLAGHTGAVWSVAFTPDGNRVVSGGHDASIRVWDIASGQELHRFAAPDLCVWSVAVSQDGRQVLSGSGGGPGTQPETSSWSVCLWELESGRQLNRLAGDQDWVTSVAFSADGRRALFGMYWGKVVWWDLENWQEIKRFQAAKGLWSARLSPDELRVVTAAGDQDQGDLRLWDLKSGGQVQRLLGHDHGVWQAIYLPGGRRIISAGNDNTVRVWNLETGKDIQRFSTAGTATCLAVSADGQHLISGGFGPGSFGSSAPGAVVRLWNLQTGKELQAFAGHTQGLQAVAISQGGRWAASGSHDHTVRLWKLPPAVHQTATTPTPTPNP